MGPFAVGAVIAALAAPWYVPNWPNVMLYYHSASTATGYSWVSSQSLLSATSLTFYARHFIADTPPVMLACIGLGLVALLVRRPAGWGVVAGWLVVGYTLLTAQTVKNDMYLGPLVPALAVAGGAWAPWLAGWARAARAREDRSRPRLGRLAPRAGDRPDRPHAGGGGNC